MHKLSSAWVTSIAALTACLLPLSMAVLPALAEDVTPADGAESAVEQPVAETESTEENSSQGSAASSEGTSTAPQAEESGEAPETNPEESAQEADSAQQPKPSNALPREGEGEPLTPGAGFRSVPPSGTTVPRGSALVRVKVGGDRTRLDGDPAPVQGVTMKLYQGTRERATCVSDANGYCTFTVQNPSGTGWSVRATAVPSGWVRIPQLTIGDAGRTDTWAQEQTVNYSVPLQRTKTGREEVALWTYRNVQQYEDITLVPGQYYESGKDFMTTDPTYPYSVGGSNTYYRRTPWNSRGFYMVARENPALPVERCNLKIAFITDLTRSMYWDAPTQPGESGRYVGETYLNHEALALRAFVQRLGGTNTSFSFYSFGPDSPNPYMRDRSRNGADGAPNQVAPINLKTRAGVQRAYDTFMTRDGNNRFFPPEVNQRAPWTMPKDWRNATNWDRAFYRVAQASDTYDVAILLSDGEPNIYNAQQGSADYIQLRSLEEGIASANALKAKGTRILVAGVGGTNSGRAKNMAAVSGPTAGSDYFQFANRAYTDMATQLAKLVADNCRTEVEVVKKIVPNTAPAGSIEGATVAGDWNFTANSSRAGLPVRDTASKRTNSTEGKASWYINGYENDNTLLHELTDITLTETQQNGYSLVPVDGQNAVCIDKATNENIVPKNAGNTANPAVVVPEVHRGQRIQCTFYNRQSLPPQVTLLKKVDNSAGVIPAGQVVASESSWNLTLTPANSNTPKGTVPGNTVISSANTIKNIAEGQYRITEASGTESRAYEQIKVQRLKRGTPIPANGVVNHDDASLWEDIDPNSISITQGTNDVYRFVNAPKPGKIKWNKVRSGTTTLLSGSEWRVEHVNGTTSLGLISDPNSDTVADCVASSAAQCTGQDKDPAAGKFLLENVKWGSYRISETTPPEGYDLAGTQYTALVDKTTVSRTDSTSVVNGTGVTNGNIPNVPTVRGTKRIDKTDAGTGRAIAGAKWRITRVDDNGSVVETIADPGTDTVADCTAQNTCRGRDKDPVPGQFWLTDLTIGKYEVREVQAPLGYVQTTDVYTFDLRERASNPALRLNGETQPYNKIRNERIPGKIRWNKVDAANTSSLLPGSEWTMTGTVNGRQVTITDSGFDGIRDCTAAPCSGVDRDPEAGRFLVENLDWGDYTLTEKTAPLRYERSETTYTFVVDAASVTTPSKESVLKNGTTTVDRHNILNTKPRGQKRIDKVHRITNKANPNVDTHLPGSVWSLVRVDERGNVLERIADPGAETITDCIAARDSECTGRDRTARTGELWIDGLPNGSYELREVTAPEGYQLTTDVYYFDITPTSYNNPDLWRGKGPGREWVRNSVANEQIPGKIRWNKIDAESSRLLAGSHWTLERIENTGRVSVTDSGVENIADCIAVNADDCIGQDKDPSAGKFLVTDLPWGNYVLTEHTAPTGYDPSTVEYTFTVNKESVTSATGESVLKNGESTVEGHNVPNTKQPRGFMRINKVDAKYRDISLPGAVWYITRVDDNGAVLESLNDPKTDTVADCVAASRAECTGMDQDPKAGQIWLTNLLLGKYEVREDQPPAGYARTDALFTFEVTRDKTTGISLKQGDTSIDGNKIPNTVIETPTLPYTGGMGVYLPAGIGAVIVAMGAALARRRMR